MRERYVGKLEQLHRELLEMGMLCEKAIMGTYRLLATAEGREKQAAEIDAMEQDIDNKERNIETLSMQLLLQQQPVAADLRRISAALKMITDLERIGDQATDIAEIMQTGSIEVPVKGIAITEMAEFTMNMVNKSVESYVQQDLAMALEVIASDDTLDEMFVKIRREINEGMRDGSFAPDQGMDLLMIAKYYERIGDHATNVGEWVEFSITGKHRSGKTVNDIFRQNAV